MNKKTNNKRVNAIIIVLSIVVAALVSVLAKVSLGGAEQLPWDVHLQPRLHAILNSITAVLLILGFWFIRNKMITAHRFSMMSAFVVSGLFLVSYVIYHALTESTSFGGTGFIKIVYYFILVSHIVLAALIFPLILMTMHRAITNQIEKHKKLARITFPLWLYVAVTGVVVYLMIAPYY